MKTKLNALDNCFGIKTAKEKKLCSTLVWLKEKVHGNIEMFYTKFLRKFMFFVLPERKNRYKLKNFLQRYSTKLMNTSKFAFCVFF
jgi:hypothetical protein